MEKNKHTARPLIETLIAAAAFLLMLAAAKYTLITALLLPFIGAFVCARQDAAWITAFYITAGAFFYLLLSGHWWLYFAVFILASLPAGFAIRFKLRSFDAIIISCAGFALAAASLIAYVYFYTGNDILTFATERVNAALESSDTLLRSVYLFARSTDVVDGSLTASALMSASTEQMLSYLASESFISYVLSYTIPVYAMQTVVAGGFLTFICTRALLRRLGTEVCRIPSFERFYLPRKTSKYFVLLYLLSALPSLFSWQDLLIAGYVLSTLVETVFMIQGISFVYYLLGIKIKMRGLQIFLTIIISLFLSGVLVYAGLIEQLIRIRDAKFTLQDQNKNGGNGQ